MIYHSETGKFVAYDKDDQVCLKCDVPAGDHNLPDYVASVEEVDDPSAYSVHEMYLDIE